MSTINEQITARKFYSGFDETTYYRKDLFSMFVRNHTDHDILFKLKIYGFYKNRYKWTNAQCDYFIENNLLDSRSHEVNGMWYSYDWGAGFNKLTADPMHEPHLDHIIPREQGGKDTPENMRIRCRRLNMNKGNTNSDQERYATIVDMLNDMDDEGLRAELVSRLYDKYCI